MQDINHLSQRLRHPDVSITKLDDGSGVLLDLPGHQVLALNDTGIFLLERLLAGGETSTDSLLHDLLDEFDIDRDTASSDLGAFLEQLDGLFAQD